MPSDPLPEPPSNQNVRDAEWFDKGWKAAMRRIAEGEQEARTLARAEVLDVDALAEALHDAMCDVSHHDRAPARCSRWAKYPNIAATTARRYAVHAAALSWLGERE